MRGIQAAARDDLVRFECDQCNSTVSQKNSLTQQKEVKHKEKTMYGRGVGWCGGGIGEPPSHQLDGGIWADHQETSCQEGSPGGNVQG